MSKALIVGLTGPSGAGKSTVSSYFMVNSIPVINADKVAREVTLPGSSGLNELVETFSSNILNDDGTLNRAFLANLCFTDKENLKKLNAITHPKILELIKTRIDELAKDDKNKIIVLDAPTLFESGCDKFCDVIVSVTASMGSRLKRIQARDKIDVHSAMERISAQPDDEFYITKSNRVIKNDGSSEALTLEINNTILWLRKQANEKNEIF